MSEQIWSDEMVEAMKWYQESGVFHPYTCGNCRDKLGTRFLKTETGELVKEPPDYKSWEGDNWKNVVVLDRELTPTNDGFVCLTCGYKQKWLITGMTLERINDMRQMAEAGNPLYQRIINT